MPFAVTVTVSETKSLFCIRLDDNFFSFGFSLLLFVSCRSYIGFYFCIWFVGDWTDCFFFFLHFLLTRHRSSYGRPKMRCFFSSSIQILCFGPIRDTFRANLFGNNVISLSVLSIHSYIVLFHCAAKLMINKKQQQLVNAHGTQPKNCMNC